MSDEVRVIDVSEAEYVPEGVLEGIEEILNGESASKEELREAFLNDPDDNGGDS